MNARNSEIMEEDEEKYGAEQPPQHALNVGKEKVITRENQ